MKLVSIIVPVYNSQPYLAELIGSVINQTYNNWELLLIDDHSSDNSYSIMQKYMNTDMRIKAIKRPDNIMKGGDACRNYGLMLSKGEYIVFIDADDLLAPYCIDQRVNAMEDNPNLDFGIFPALSFKEIPLDYNIICYGFHNTKNVLNNLINKALPFVVWNNIYRRCALIKNDIFWDEKLLSNQDADFNIRCVDGGMKYKEFDVLPDYFWRYVSNSTSKKIISKAHGVSNIYYFNKISSSFINRPQYESDLKILALWILSVLVKSKDSSTVSNFLECSYFNRNNYFNFRVKKLYKLLITLFNINAKLFMLSKFIFFPYLFLKSRYVNEYFPFNSRKRKKIRVLTMRYIRYMNSK